MSRIQIYAIITAVLLTAALITYFFASSYKLGEPNIFDVAMFLIVIGGAAVALVSQEFQGRVKLADFRRQWVEELRMDIVALMMAAHPQDGSAVEKAKIAQIGTKVLLMINKKNKLFSIDDGHQELMDQVNKILDNNGITVDHELVRATRAVLKNGWDQTVQETR